MRILMKRLKTYKQLFESEHFDSFELIKDYINEFCDNLDLDLYPNDTKVYPLFYQETEVTSGADEKIYLKANSMVYLFGNSWIVNLREQMICS